MKTPEQWAPNVFNCDCPSETAQLIASIQADARKGMVPAAELRPTIELLHMLRNRYSAFLHAVTVHGINVEINRLETLLGENQPAQKDPK